MDRRNKRRQRSMKITINEIQKKYLEVVENVNCIVLRWTPDGLITFINRYGREFFGYAEEELIGKHVVGTIVPEKETTGRDLRLLLQDVCRHPERYEHNTNQNMCKSGKLVWVEWVNKLVYDERTKKPELLSLGIDISKRVQAEEELRQLNETLERRIAERTAELQAALEKAQSADRLKSAFLATMSHELRTPLNSIIGFTGILLQGLAGPLNEEQTKQLGMIRDSARHLLDLINDILDISKIEAGQLEVAAEAFDVRRMIEEVLEAVMQQAAKKGLTIGAAIAHDVSEMVSDRRRVKQILLNLASNAVKFTQHGEVRLECKTQGDTITFSVHDTGIGIRQDDMDNLFKPFQQIDTGLTRAYEGTGLGLSICKRLVERLGGSISVQSVYGKGSTFTCMLPVVYQASSA
ncbi:MAG: ATP-binding protein [Desulfobacterota bacterium]|nr:ATP-binding protein [Thermodesulfobacteriota bacterium]